MKKEGIRFAPSDLVDVQVTVKSFFSKQKKNRCKDMSVVYVGSKLTGGVEDPMY